MPPGAAAVLINRNHTYTDLYLPIDAVQLQLLERIDGDRSIGEVAGTRGERDAARVFFPQLWRWDQIVFDMSRSGRAIAS